MIIFGFRTFVKALAVLTLVCRQCGNPSAHRLVQRSRWFTLFFIPVIPFGFTRFTTCTFCGTTTKVTKEEAEQLMATSQGGAAPAQQALAVDAGPTPPAQPPVQQPPQ